MSSLSWWRDLVIVVFAGLGIVATLIFIALSLVIYRKVLPILDSARSTFSNIKGTSSFVSETVVKPIVKGAGFVAGVRRAAAIIMRLSKRKGGRKDV